MPQDVKTSTGWALGVGDETESGFYGEFWRLTLGAGDRLTLDEAITNTECSGETRGIAMFDPSVTDYTLADADWADSYSMHFRDKGEYVWTAPSAGRWTVHFYGCQTTSLDFTTRVQHPTAVTLHARSLLQARHKLRLKGKVTGLAGGQVILTITSPTGRHKTRLVQLTTTGRFSWSTRPRRVGRYKIRIRYPGDPHHLASSDRATVRVI